MSDRKVTLLTIPVEGSDKANQIEVSIYYSLGGLNYFTGTDEGRGIYYSATPLTITPGEGYSTRTYTAFSGVKRLVNRLARFSRKKLDDEVAAPDWEMVDKLVEHVASKIGGKLDKSVFVNDKKVDDDFQFLFDSLSKGEGFRIEYALAA